jgi:lipid A 3-O-deacylase
MGRLIGLVLLAAASIVGAADAQLAVSVGQAADSQHTDVMRLTYRQALSSDAQPWWRPQQLQVGLGIWRVHDLDGRTRRYDASVTPVWRGDVARGYIEGGIGVYLLSHTINNESHRLPSSLQFGSHLGAGLSFGKASIGLALQHLSNAGIKKPNGGINFYLLTVSVPL